ncbi:hypothetical protein V498_06821 [Pseudogymnoascus sp. VKM F-4517 (FW-2822)]|nr:hypothetical protein V498_06821 [Pseudogymnoascus sp. VKM F-4517 (FW-2822)]
MTLEGIVSDNTPKPLRQRWADQVTSSSNRAHEAEIVWGDAKAANVLVDVDMDAWVISTLEMGSYRVGFRWRTQGLLRVTPGAS